MSPRTIRCCRRSGRRNDMRLCAGWPIFQARCIPPLDGSGGARFCDDPDCESSVEHAAAAQLADAFAYVDKHISNRRSIAGDRLTVADFYLFEPLAKRLTN